MSNHDLLAHRHDEDEHGPSRSTYLRRGLWVFIAFAAIAALFLLSEHRAHVLGALPYVLLLACPLLHMFMHGGHGHGGHGGHSHGSEEQPTNRGNEGKDWT